jgi:hypothetical protein
MTKPPAASSQGRKCRLVQQDIHLARDAETQRVVASVVCARKACVTDVDSCGRCPHFVRIDTHEAGYVLLCTTTPGDAPPEED